MQTPFPEHWFSAYVDGELSDAEREQVEHALAEQPEYRQLVDELTAMRSALRQLPRESFEGDVRERVLQRAERAMFEPASLAADKVQPKRTSSNQEPARAAAPAARSRRSRTRLIAALLATSAALLLAFVAFFSQTAPQTIAVHMLSDEAAAPKQMAAQREERTGRQGLPPGDHDGARVDEVREDVPADEQETDSRAPVEQPLEGEALGIAPSHADADEYDDFGDSASAVAESRYRDRLYEPGERQSLQDDLATRGVQQTDRGLMYGSVDDYGPLSGQPYDAILYVTLHPEASDRKIIQEALETLSPIATDDAGRDSPAQVSEVDSSRPARQPSASRELSEFQVPGVEEAEARSTELHRFARPGAGEQEPLRELDLRLASHEQLQEAVERLRSLKPDVLEVHLTPSQPLLGGGFGYFPSERMERHGLGGMGGRLGGMDSVGAGIRGREAEAEAESPKQSAESKPEAFYDITPPRLPRRGRLQEDQPGDRRLARPGPAVPAPAEPALAEPIPTEPAPAEPEVAERIRAESADPESELEVAEEAERDVLDDAAAPQHGIPPPARANGRAGDREVQSGLPVQPDGLLPGALDAASVDAEAEIEEAPVPKASTLGASQFFSHTFGPMPPGAIPAPPYRLPAYSERQTLRVLIVVQPGER